MHCQRRAWMSAASHVAPPSVERLQKTCSRPLSLWAIHAAQIVPSEASRLRKYDERLPGQVPLFNRTSFAHDTPPSSELMEYGSQMLPRWSSHATLTDDPVAATSIPGPSPALDQCACGPMFRGWAVANQVDPSSVDLWKKTSPVLFHATNTAEPDTATSGSPPVPSTRSLANQVAPLSNERLDRTVPLPHTT